MTRQVHLSSVRIVLRRNREPQVIVRVVSRSQHPKVSLQPINHSMPVKKV